MACVTFFSVYSVAYFVGLSVPLALKSMAMITIYVTGSVVYIAQSYNVAKEFLVDYGNLLGNDKACLVKQQEIGLVAAKAETLDNNDVLQKLVPTPSGSESNGNEISKKNI